MNDEQRQFLATWDRPPARLTTDQAAWALNCSKDDIPILITAKLLKPLGDPAPNATKYFATVEIESLARDSAMLAKVTKAIYNHHKGKNQRRKAAGS